MNRLSRRAKSDTRVVRPDSKFSAPVKWLLRIAVVVAFVSIWQFVPTIIWLRQYIPAADPYFVSSPYDVAVTIRALVMGDSDLPSVWPYVGYTLSGTFLGGFIGIGLGVIAGLLFSNGKKLSQVFSPFITMLNATPRVALVPIFVIVFGLSLTTSVVTAIFVVFFSVFYNAYKGGVGIPHEIMDSSRLLGASGLDIMLRIRLRYVLVWTFAALPNAIALSLIGVVTAEILAGSGGMGGLIVSALATQNSSLTFSIVVLLSVIGISLVQLAEIFESKLLHWWTQGS